MHTDHKTESDFNRIILLGAAGSELLVQPKSERVYLPHILLVQYQRVAEQLTAFTEREFSHVSVSLFKLDRARNASQHCYQVMECVDEDLRDTGEYRWVPVNSLDELEWGDPEDSRAVKYALARCTESASDRKNDAFGRLGWMADLTDWVRDLIQPTGLYLNGRFSQFNASSTFSLIRFETNGQALWFKAVGEPNLREFPITQALSSDLSEYVPRLVGVREECNGWLACEHPGKHPDETSDLEVWRRIATTLADLQIASLGQTLHFLDLGCLDTRFDSLRALVEPFFSAIGEPITQQHDDSAPPLSSRELSLLQLQLQGFLSEMENFEIPNALGHLDLNLGNIVASRDGCVFLDWAAACVGSPLVSFQFVVQQLRRARPRDPSWESVVTSAYVDKWRPFVASRELTAAIASAPLLALFAYSSCGTAWKNEAFRSRPEVAAYLCNLTRRMKQAMDSFRTRRSQCVL
jgi:hypothetical protein